MERTLICDRRVLLFIDNWRVLDSYIPDKSKERTWREILAKIEEIDGQYPACVWASRVPSGSNIADAPSRGSLDALQFLGKVELDHPVCPMTAVGPPHMLRKWVLKRTRADLNGGMGRMRPCGGGGTKPLFASGE